jgi:hypothetical protein
MFTQIQDVLVHTWYSLEFASALTWSSTWGGCYDSQLQNTHHMHEYLNPGAIENKLWDGKTRSYQAMTVSTGGIHCFSSSELSSLWHCVRVYPLHVRASGQ